MVYNWFLRLVTILLRMGYKNVSVILKLILNDLTTNKIQVKINLVRK
jgi:hypothetical protein